MRSSQSSTPRPAGRRRPLFDLVAGASSVGLLVGGLALGSVVTNPTATAAPVANVAVAARPALPEGTAALGQISSTRALSGDVALVPRDASLLASYAAAVSQPGSPEYRHYLSPSAFAAAFSPITSTVAAVESYLRSDGLKITSLSQNKLLVGFTGAASKVDATFHTSIENYRTAGGRVAFANDSAVTVPSTLSSAIQAVVGLNDLVAPQPAPLARDTTPSAAPKVPRSTPPAGAAKACKAANTQASLYGALTANDVAYAYGLDPLYAAKDFGQDQTIDILDLFGYSTSDVTSFDECYFGTTDGATVVADDSVDNVDNGAEPGNGAGGSVETELDVESANAYAPQANVVVYEAPDSDSGFLDDVAAMTASNAKVESISYGECEETELAETPGYLQ